MKTITSMVAVVITVLSLSTCFNKKAIDPDPVGARDASTEDVFESKHNVLDDSVFDFIEDTADDCSGDLTPPAVKPGETVLLVGDSLGVGLSTEFKKIAKKSGYIPITHVVSGTTTKFWSKAILNDLDMHKPTLVVVSLGTNDAVNSGYDSKVYEDFAVSVNDAGAFVVWVGPPAIKTTKIKKIDMTRDLIKSSVPNFFESEKVDIPLGDGIHSTGLGYSKWMSAAWKWMGDLGIVVGS